MNESFRRIQVRITAWYVGVFAAILVLFGAGVYLAVTHQIGRVLDQQLVAATSEIERAMAIREKERGVAAQAVDALQELRIPGRELYVFDASASALGGMEPPAALASLAREALAGGDVWARPEVDEDRTLRVYARRMVVGGQPYVAVAVADAVEVEDRYPGLLASFLVASLGALVLVGLGGWGLARKSLIPVEASMERMRRFVADASHELRTPAAVLRTRAEVALQRARTVKEYANMMRTMQAEAERLGRLVDGLLLLAAADEDRLPLRKQEVFLDDLLVQASEPARTLAASKGVALEMGAFDEAPADADPELVRRMFLSVLENAVKYTPPSGHVRAEVTADASRCSVSVQDDGPGIPPEILPHVFERFYRADPARQREGGSGLGLAIAKSIADAHGAEITLDSEVGRGTTVRMSFPRRATAAAVAVALCLGSFLAGAGSAAAQQAPPPVPLSLGQALERAASGSPWLEAAGADSAAADAGLRQARAYPNPELSLEYTRDIPRNHVSLDLPLDLPWLRGPRIRGARALAAAGTLGVDVARAELRYQVEAAYGAAAGGLALRRLSEQALEDGREMLRIAEAQEASGDAARLDVAVARIALGELEHGMLLDSLAALDAVTALQSLLGMGQDRVLVELTDSLKDVPLPGDEGPRAPLRLEGADSVVVAGRSGLSLARRSRFPSPAVGFGFERGDPTGETDGILPLARIGIPLPLFDRGGATVRQAEAELRRAEAARAALQREVSSALEAARRGYRTALGRLAVDDAAVADALRVATLSRDAYREGAYPLTSVLEAQRGARDVLRRRIEDLVAAREAAAAYRFAMTAGGMTP